MNVCPDCEINVIPKLHPDLRAGAICTHRLMEMNRDEYRALFPALDRVTKEIVEIAYEHIRQEGGSVHAPETA